MSTMKIFREGNGPGPAVSFIMNSGRAHADSPGQFPLSGILAADFPAIPMTRSYLVMAITLMKIGK